MSNSKRLIAGIDIGNSTTECAIASRDEEGNYKFLGTSITGTTGIKGTTSNVEGVMKALEDALDKSRIDMSELDVIRINEATPVIGDLAMETISETVIIDSAMIGHNPFTPSGAGLATGRTIDIKNVGNAAKGISLIAVIPADTDFEDASAIINCAAAQGISISGAIVQKDDAVLINNRLKSKIPIVDEVLNIEKVPCGMDTVVEVAQAGETVKTISNPFGLATVFNLSPLETKNTIPIAKSLIGTRSGVVIKTPGGDVKLDKLPAGKLKFITGNESTVVDVMDGADAVMNARHENGMELSDVEGEANTNAGEMIKRVKETMANLTDQQYSDMKIRDLLAIDTFNAVKVQGGIAGEVAMENAVMLAAMVKTSRLPMEKIAKSISDKTGIYVKISGAEAKMAILGALTTPGTSKPLVILDMGGGSTDAALLDNDGNINSIHLAGAGDLVTMLIKSELNLDDKDIAEVIKVCPLAKVESLLQIRYEDSNVKYFEKPLNPELFQRVVAVSGEKLIPIKTTKPYDMERIRHIRREAKKKVFITNAHRALSYIAPEGNLRNIGYVVLVGGSALDFEITELLTEFLSQYRIVSGRGNIRGTEGPRNAVATGLVLSEGVVMD